jgi:hypothetical protein
MLQSHERNPTEAISLSARETNGFSMGRTVPTFCQLVQEAGQHWVKFRRALHREDQPHFDRLFHSVRGYAQAATYQGHDNPMETILLSIALDLEKRLAALEKLAGCYHAPQWMDTRPLPLTAGDDVEADRSDSETPPAD